MASFQLLLFLGYFATAQAAFALDCTNDYEKIFCQLSVSQCSQYSVDIQNSDGYGKYYCSLGKGKCNSKQCCCSVRFDPIPGETYHVKAFRGVEEVNSTTIDILKSLKPKTPTIVSVDAFERIFTVRWKTNMDHFSMHSKLKFEVTFSKKGDTKKVCKLIEPAVADGLQSYQIGNEELEPVTAYMVSVRSYWDYSQKFSDRSKEFEFETSIQQDLMHMWIIIGFSIFGMILFISVYACFVMTKSMRGDYLKPKALSMQVGKLEFLKPQRDTTSLVQIKDPPLKNDQMQKTSHEQSEVNMNPNSRGDSSDPCYGQTEPPDHKALINAAIRKALLGIIPKDVLFPDSPPELSTVPQDEKVPGLTSNDTSSASSGISNRTYFMPGLSSPGQSVEDNSKVKLLNGLRNTCKSNTAFSKEETRLAFTLLFPGLKESSFIVQPSYSVDPQSTLGTKNTSLCSSSSGNITPSPSLSSCEPSGSHQFPVTDDNYKPFPNKVEQTNVLISEKQSGEHRLCLNVNQDERVIKVPEHSFILDLKNGNGPFPSVLQTPHFPMMSSDTSIPVMVESDYKCV